MTDRSQCQNCQQIWDNDQLDDIRDFHQRVAPGEPCPSGECPECGAVCHPYPKELSSGDKLIATIARMKTVVEFGDDSPPFEDWMETLDNIIAEAREITGIETPDPQDRDSPEPGAGMEIMICDDCGNALEEGRIGLCDNCTPLPALTPERIEEFAEACSQKACDVDAGVYGADVDNESWAANLRRAAARLRMGEEGLAELNDTDIEEIQCCTNATENEIAYLDAESEAT